MTETLRRCYVVRHAHTNCVVGEYHASLPSGLFQSRLAPMYYKIPVLPSLEDIMRVPKAPTGRSCLENGGIRAATLIINGDKSRTTVWVPTASELFGLPGYIPY